ncbi:5195_t:CDS:10, partial [Ambispora leptoticha]
DLYSYVSVLFRDVNDLSKGYWNRDPSRWGGLCDWDMFFIQQIPEATKQNVHNSLAAELKVLMRLPPSNPCHQHAVLMMTSLKVKFLRQKCQQLSVSLRPGTNHTPAAGCRVASLQMAIRVFAGSGGSAECTMDCHKNDLNVNLWSKRMKELAELTVANRVDTASWFSVESAAFTTGATVLKDHFERKTADLLRNNLTSGLVMSQETVSEGMPDEINETPVMKHYKQAQLADPDTDNIHKHRHKMMNEDLSNLHCNDNNPFLVDGTDNDHEYQCLIELAIDEYLDNEDTSKFQDSGNVLEPYDNSHENSMDVYPKDDSPPDVWMLPSGKQADKIVKVLPRNAHDYHPSQFNIIRLGVRVRRPSSILQEDWEYLQNSFEFTRELTSPKSDEILELLAESDSAHNLEQALKVLQIATSDRQAMFFRRTLEMFLEIVFLAPKSALRSSRTQESTLGSLMLHPLLDLLTREASTVEYHPGEIHSAASASQRVLRRRPLVEDDRPLGQKVDGLFVIDDTEVGLVEMTGGPTVRDLPRYIKDHVRGYWGMRDLLNGIAADTKYCQGSFAVMRRLRVYFIQTHGLDIETWAMDCPVSELFRMYFVGCGKLPLHWNYKNELITLLPLLWDLKNGLEKTGNSLELLKLTSGQVLAKSRSRKRHQTNDALNTYFHTQQQKSPMLADTKRDTKKARTLKPHEDYPEK